MRADIAEQFGFNPVKNMFPEMKCRVCNARNPFVFFAPKPESGYPGAIWLCVCSHCAETTLDWVNRRTGQLKPGVTL